MVQETLASPVADIHQGSINEATQSASRRAKSPGRASLNGLDVDPGSQPQKGLSRQRASQHHHRKSKRCRVFISYRRNDSIVYAKLIHNELAHEFGDDHVFMDIEDIRYGDDFKKIIDKEIAACDVQVVVIGPQWLELLTQRPADTDYVRYEIALALARRADPIKPMRVIPVLVGKALPPLPDTLPPDLAALGTINDVVFDEHELPQSIHTLIETVRGQSSEETLQTTIDRIRLARLAKVVGVAIGLAVFCAAWVALLDLLSLDTRFTSLTMWLSRHGATVSQSADLILVTIDDKTEERIGRPFDSTWRREHAQLIERLARAGARTVALDLSFKQTMPVEDATLAGAIASARSRQTAVVVAVEALEDRMPRLAPGLGPAVLSETGESQEGLRWGIACSGRKLGFIGSIPLVIARGETLLPSFALAAFGGLGTVDELDTARLEVSGALPASRKRAKVGFSMVENVRRPQRDCPAVATHDRIALQLLDLSPPGFWLQSPRRLAYEQVLESTSDEALAFVKDKIVLVGVTKPGDVHEVAAGLWTEQRFGIEFLADQIDALLRGDVVRPLSGFTQFGCLLALGLGGAFVWRWGAPPRPALVRRGLLLGVMAVYLVTAVYVCREYRLLLNIPYELGAFVLAYWTMQWTAGKAHDDT